MDNKSRQNNELALKCLFHKFDNNELFIDITIENNQCNVWRECERLGEIIDSYSTILPHDGSSWAEYIPERVGMWTYLRVQKKQRIGGVSVVGTASEESPNGKQVATVDEILRLADGRQMIMDEDFDAVFS